MNDREKAQVFVSHIMRHLDLEKGEKVICKICGQDIDQIYHDFLESMGDKKPIDGFIEHSENKDVF